ncbi:hypothetical protein J3R83DRAFT_10706 [Lanmaoa asiatica]|nr:hypothetical protein J3R83DRAFT_10706 [Lanmaoa asiatica]
MTVNPTTDMQPPHHDKYYYPKGTHIFCVEHILYKLHDDILSSHSDLFRDMFETCDLSTRFAADINPENPKEGQSDVYPIVLEGERSEAFDLFLDHIYTQ